MNREERSQGMLLDVILVALRGYVEHNVNENNNDEEARYEEKINFSYLLGQAIRQWQIPECNWHKSENALALWKEISNQELTSHFQYKEIFECVKSITIPRFKGATRDFDKIGNLSIKRGDNIAFNEIFIAEHTIPVSDIRDALVVCYKRNQGWRKIKLKRELTTILNKMHITQMLKIEDRRIKTCTARVKKLCEDELRKTNPSPTEDELRDAVYKYLRDTESIKIFEKIKDNYYHCKKGTILPETNDYRTALSIANNETWAEAVKLDNYPIEIA